MTLALAVIWFGFIAILAAAIRTLTARRAASNANRQHDRNSGLRSRSSPFEG